MLWVFIIYFIIIGVFIMTINFYLFVVYCHADEKGIGDRFFYKIVVVGAFFNGFKAVLKLKVGGMGIAWSFVLFYPMDVANSQ